MPDKILIVGNAGNGKSMLESLIRKQFEKTMDEMILHGTAASTSTCSAWDTPPLTQKTMMDMIYKMEEGLKPCKADPFPFPINKPLYEDYNLTERKQIKFPRCNKKKIWKLKRWEKNPANFKHVPDSKIYYTKDFAVCHPQTAHALKQIPVDFRLK